MKLHGRTILVVGATSGMGLELTRQLLKRQCTVIGWSRRAASLPELLAGKSGDARDAKEAGEGGGKLFPIAGDVRHQEDIDHLPAYLDANGLDLDGICYCAGVSRPDDVDAPDLARAVDTLRTNAEGAFRVFFTLLPRLRRKPEGFLAGWTSMAADAGFPKAAAYCAGKAALDRLLESLRIDLWGSGIRVFTIVPGFVDTPMSRQNKYPMHGVWPPEKAVRHILARMEREVLIIRFPWYHSLGMTLLGLLPQRLSWWLMHRHRSSIRIDPQPTDEFQW